MITWIRRKKELSIVLTTREQLRRATVDGAATATPRLIQEWDSQLQELDLLEQIMIGQIQACKDVMRRLEQTTPETEANLEQTNLIDESGRKRIGTACAK